MRELLQRLARRALAVLPALQQPSVGRKREWLQKAGAEQEHSWMTHTPWWRSGWFGCCCFQKLRLHRRDVFQMEHPRQKPTSGTANLWPLKTTNGVQSPELFCARNGGWQEKPRLLPTEGRPFLAYINPSHKRIFSFMNLQKGFKEIKREQQITNARLALRTYNLKILHRFSPYWYFSRRGRIYAWEVIRKYKTLPSDVWCLQSYLILLLRAAKLSCSWHWWEVGPLEADEDPLTLTPVTPVAAHWAQQDASQGAVGELNCGLSQRDLIWISGNLHRHFPYKKSKYKRLLKTPVITRIEA